MKHSRSEMMMNIYNAPGHAIVHKTTQRHAGAPTTSGIRDILVIFLTARRPKEILPVAENTWGIESAMRLQSVAKEMQTEISSFPSSVLHEISIRPIVIYFTGLVYT